MRYDFFTEVEERFYFLSRGWDVRQAKVLLSARRPKTQPISVEDAATSLGFIRIDKDRVEDVDLNFPVIVSPVTVPGQDLEQFMVIDGWHRVAKAKQEGIKVLQAFVLTEGEAKRIAL